MMTFEEYINKYKEDLLRIPENERKTHKEIRMIGFREDKPGCSHYSSQEVLDAIEKKEGSLWDLLKDGFDKLTNFMNNRKDNK